MPHGSGNFRKMSCDSCLFLLKKETAATAHEWRLPATGDTLFISRHFYKLPSSASYSRLNQRGQKRNSVQSAPAHP